MWEEDRTTETKGPFWSAMNSVGKCMHVSDDIMWLKVTAMFMKVGNEAGVIPLCWSCSSSDYDPMLHQDIWRKIWS